MRSRRPTQAGFSLIELMVAMAITLIISGAIYGLLAGGQNAFRKEPEMTERQQNIRLAMDLIMRDAASAGVGMPSFLQTFTQGLDGAFTLPDGTVTDELEILGNPGGLDSEPVCGYPGGKAAVARLARKSATIVTPMVVFIFGPDGSWTIRQINDTATNSSKEGNCDGNPKTQIQFNSGKADTSGLNMPGGLCEANGFGNLTVDGSRDCPVQCVGLGELIHYRIRMGTGAEANIPMLERASSLNNNTFQVVARGIDNLQVKYKQANGAVSDGAPAITNCGSVTMCAQASTTCVSPPCPTPAPPCTSAAAFGTLITEVTVTLSGRTTGAQFQGAGAFRRTLTSSATPRMALQTASACPTTSCATPVWQ